MVKVKELMKMIDDAIASNKITLEEADTLKNTKFTSKKEYNELVSKIIAMTN